MYAVFCGSRDWTDGGPVREQLMLLDPERDVVIHGAARGADSVADREARAGGFRVLSVPADWEAHGLRAGPVRNARMTDALVEARAAGELVLVFAFHEDQGLGRGTRDMVRRAASAGVTTVLVASRAPDVRTASFTLCDPDGRMLVQHRTDDAPTFPGHWGLFGGAVEPGEDVAQALAREAEEELLLGLPGMEGLGPHTFLLPDGRTMEINAHVGPLPVPMSVLERDQREGQGLALLTLEELSGMRVPSQDLHVFRAVRARLRQGPIV